MNFSDVGIDLGRGVTDGTTFRPVPPNLPPLGYYGDTRELLIKAVLPIIIACGTLGNIWTMMILIRQKKRISSTSIYLLILAISDTGILWCAPVRTWMKYMWDIDLRHLSDVSCRTHLYFTHTFIHLSSWILAAVTMERTIGIVSPHKVKFYCTSKHAALVTGSIFVLIFGIDLVIPMTSSIHGYQPFKGHAPVKCAPTSKDNKDFRDNIWQWTDLLLAFLIPVVCLVIGNVVIIWHLQKTRQTHNITIASEERRDQQTRRRDTSSVTALMIALSITFFLTMTPVAVFQIYYPYRYEEIEEMFQKNLSEAWEAYQYLLLQQTTINLVSYTNASLKFVLYMLCNTEFREELKATLFCTIKKRNDVFGSIEKSVTGNDAKSTKILKNLDKQIGKISYHTNGQYGRNKDDIVQGGYLNNVDRVFISDEISSLSSILSNHNIIDKDIYTEQVEKEKCESFDELFTDSGSFPGNPREDNIRNGKELNGFILHI